MPNITRFPVFWEDDWHWRQTGGDWELRHYLDAFTSPGLKIINVHPFILSANIPSEDYYLEVKEHTTTLSQEDIDTIRYDGAGGRTFFIDLIEFVRSQNMRFYTLHELYHMFPVKSFLVSEDETKGRASKFSDEDHKKYWQMSDADKQQYLKESDYQQRNATDIYATSRDFHARELEIQAITEGISKRGTVLDLGCGNGYTLISLAKRLKDWTMVGVDFSEKLIDGARFLIEKEKRELQSHPEFICGDAVQYINGLKDESLEYVITERFILNLPSVEWQRKVIQQIYKVLKKGGRFLMCEGSEAGLKHLNELRRQVGLRIIPATSADNISAIRIVDDEFEEYIQSEIGFKILKKLGMSHYFIMSRVLHPLMVQPLEPRFDSNFNNFAKLIQEHSEFAPGYGSNVIWVLEK
jgi:ubiquinone/menaquinone biosynthesis C-methylase UbiE